MKPLEAIANLYRFNDKFLEGVTAGFTADDWQARATDESSPASWIVGHLALCRRSLRRGLGDRIEKAEWESLFGRGTRPGDAQEAPPPEALKQDFLENGQPLCELLVGVSEEDVDSPYGHTFADGSNTKGGAAHFLLLHECYHIGQIGILRRLVGKPGVA